MNRGPPSSTRTYTLFPDTTLFRSVPVLLLSGARSDVVSRATVDEFLHVVPHAQHVELPQATHMVAGDANDAFTQEVERFVQSRSEEHTSELQSLMRTSYAVFCLKKKNNTYSFK